MNKRLNFNELLAANPAHRYYKYTSEHTIFLTCVAEGCQWKREYSRHQNALVRASRMRSAFIQHLRELGSVK